MNKRQILTTILSVLLSVFLVAGVVYAITTISGTTITLSNGATIKGDATNGVRIAFDAATGSANATGAYIYAIGKSGSTAGDIRGAEIKAKAYDSGVAATPILAKIIGASINADAKYATVALLRGLEIVLDHKAGAVVTKAVGLEINQTFNNPPPTTRYGIEINPGSHGWTADIVLSTKDASDLRAVIFTGAGTSDVEIVADVGADTLWADGSIYISVVDGAGTFWQKRSDVWTSI